MFFLSLFILSLSYIHADSDCPETEKQYILGSYKKCAMSKEGGSSTQCSYIKALCNIGNGNFDDAKYPLSLLSVSNLPNGELGDVNGLALASLVEIAYLAGDYKKARALSGELSSLISKKLPETYPYIVSEVLITKSYYDGKDSISAIKRISMLKLTSMEPLFYQSINP